MEFASKTTSIFFMDNAAEETAKMVEYFKQKPNFRVVGHTHNAETALSLIKQNHIDIIVMDVVLSGMDGFEFMEKAKELYQDNMPKIIITSTLTHSGFIQKAIMCGASYFMIKPVNFAQLEARINDVLTTPDAPSKHNENKALDEKISNIFLTVGIPAHIKGYQFLREAIKMATEKPEIVSSITKQLYPSIAEKFKTSASKVERAIRHAIEVAWNRGKIENINSIFGIKVYNQNEKPTNGEFIALVADKMLMEGY